MNVFAFSDHHPLFEYIVFLLVFAAAVVCMRLARMRTLAGSAHEWIVRVVQGKRSFPVYSDISDINRVEMVRIAVGLIAAYRYGEILFASIHSSNVTAIIWSGFAVCLSLLVAVGLFAQIAIFLLMSSSNILIDNYIGASTLGTMVLSIVLLMCLLAPAGTSLSVDSFMVRRGGRSGGLIERLWLFGSRSSSEKIVAAKFAALSAYYCICLYSVTWHLNDEAWLSGFVISWTLLSPAANPKYAEIVWWLHENFPWLAVNLGRIACYGMFVWYIALLPAVIIGGLFLRIIVIWSLAFFLISTFVLPLSYLGVYELLFWFALFAKGPIFGGKENKIVVFFDDRCNLCDRTVRFLSLVDIFHLLDFLPIRSNLELARKYGITLEVGLQDLVGVQLQSQRVYQGYSLYSKLTRIILLLWPLAPLLLLGQVLKVGPIIYRWVAERRIRLFGVCTFSKVRQRPVYHDQSQRDKERRPVYSFAIFMTVVVLSIAFLVRLPIQGSHTQENWLSRGSRVIFGAAPIALGIGKINVFNLEDLKVFSGVTYFLSSFPPPDLEPSNVPHSPLLTPLVMNDAQRYQFIAQQRRMSRVNLECDRHGWSQLAAIVADAAKSNGYEQDTISALQLKFPWPSMEDLRTYRVQRYDGPRSLCAVSINVSTAEVEVLRFYQSGIDRVLRQKGLPPFLRAEYAEMATDYPQLIDSFFLRTLVAASPSLSRYKGLHDELELLGRDSWGIFSIDHLARTIEFQTGWPDLLIKNDLFPSADMCNVGISLGEKLLLLTGTPRDVQKSLKEKLIGMERMKQLEDFLGCQYAALDLRRTWFALIQKNSHSQMPRDGMGESSGPQRVL